ncbi:MAG: AEC family transporter [Clostridia bacterium]
MDLTVIFNQVLILFIILLAGFGANKLKLLTGEVCKKLSGFIMMVTMPAIIIHSAQIEFTRDKLENTLWVLGMAMGSFVISILIVEVLFRKLPGEKRAVFKFAGVFSNCGYMGFPVLYGVFGEIGIFYGAVFLIPFNLFLWTYGVLIYSREKNFKKMMKDMLNPSIIALFFGILSIIFGIRLKTPVYDAVKMLGELTTPLSMLVIGGTLALSKMREVVLNASAYLISLLRLAVIPLLCLVLFRLLGPPEIALAITILLVAMPAAAATTIFAQQYEGDAKTAASVVSVSTLLSMASIPLIMSLL